MNDKVFEGFLKKQCDEAIALANASDLLSVTPLDAPIPQHFIAEFRCKGLVLTQSGEVVEADRFLVGIFFPPDYLRRSQPWEVLTFLGPPNTFHPNIRCHEELPGAGAICVGRVIPGMRLVEILYQIYEIITYTKVNLHDSLNPTAAMWARANMARFPVDRRPLKRRVLDIQVDMRD